MDENLNSDESDTSTQNISNQESYKYTEKKKNQERPEIKPKPKLPTIPVIPKPRGTSKQCNKIEKPSLIEQRKEALQPNRSSNIPYVSAHDVNESTTTLTSDNRSSGEKQYYSECTKKEIPRLQQQYTEGNKSSSPAFGQNVEIPNSPPHIPRKKRDKTTLPTTGTTDDYGGSEGYTRVYMGDQTSDRSSSDENVEVDATVIPGVQHLHIHINLNVAQEKQRPRREKTETRRFQRKKVIEPVSATTKKAKMVPLKGRNSPLEEAPPIPPKTYRRKTESYSDSYLNAKPDESSEDMSGNESYTGQETPKYYTKKRERDYDEIGLPEFLSNGTNTDLQEQIPLEVENEFSGENQFGDTDRKAETYREQDNKEETDLEHWLYHHSQRRRAEERLKTSENGSFAVIEEDINCMPFTPFTLMVVHNNIIHIPVVKHRLKHGKVRYTLVNFMEQKLKSVQGLVNFYQKHEIPGLHLKLRITE